MLHFINIVLSGVVYYSLQKISNGSYGLLVLIVLIIISFFLLRFNLGSVIKKELIAKFKLIPIIGIGCLIFIVIIIIHSLMNEEIAEIYYLRTCILFVISFLSYTLPIISSERSIRIYHLKFYIGSISGLFVVALLADFVFRDSGWLFMFFCVGIFFYFVACQSEGIKKIMLRIKNKLN